MNYENLSPDTQVTLLLCGSTGKPEPRGEKALRPPEFARLTRWLEKRGMRPSHLLESFGINALSDFYNKSVTVGRIHGLLEREPVFAKSLKQWADRGIWMVCSFDADYPFLLKSRLKSSTPPLLYGAGNRDLLNSGGLALVGSDETDDEGFDFACQIAGVCARQDIPLISSGGKGVSNEALSAALREGGKGICVLPSSLSRATGSRIYREYLENEGFLLISPFNPESGFDEGNLSARNKYLFALAHYALVISSRIEEGETWSVSSDNLKNNWVPMFVRSGENMPEGNKMIINLGAVPLEMSIASPETKFGIKLEDKCREYNGKAEKRKADKQKTQEFYEELPEDFFDFEDEDEEKEQGKEEDEKKVEQLELPGFWD